MITLRGDELLTGQVEIDEECLWLWSRRSWGSKGRSCLPWELHKHGIHQHGGMMYTVMGCKLR